MIEAGIYIIFWELCTIFTLCCAWLPLFMSQFYPYPSQLGIKQCKKTLIDINKNLYFWHHSSNHLFSCCITYKSDCVIIMISLSRILLEGTNCIIICNENDHDIKNNVWVTLTNDFWVMSDLPIIFTSDEVTSENHWQITSQVTQKSLFMVTNVLFHFLHAILCPEHTMPLKQLLIADFAIVPKDGLSWLSIVTSPELICDIMRTLGTGTVTSYPSIVPACPNWHKSDLHLWITTAIIDFSPSGIHGFVCKNICFSKIHYK